jgi:hypothetical protein
LLPAELPCDATTAFGHAYGTTAIQSPIEMLTLNSVQVQPRPAFAPFEFIEISVSAQSRRVWSAGGAAYFEDAETARTFLANLVARFEAALTVADKVGDPAENAVTLYTGNALDCAPAGGAEECFHIDGLKIELAYREKAVYERAIDPDTVELECGNIEMEGAVIAEALGRE